MKVAWNSQHDHKAHLWPNLWKIFRSARWQMRECFQVMYLVSTKASKQANKHNNNNNNQGDCIFIHLGSMLMKQLRWLHFHPFGSMFMKQPRWLHFHPFGVNVDETTKVIAFSSIWVNVYGTTKVIAFSSIWVNVYEKQPRWLHFHPFGVNVDETTKVIASSSIWVFMKVGQLRWMGNKLSTHPCWVLRVLNKTLKFQVLWWGSRNLYVKN